MGCSHAQDGPGGCGTSQFCKYCGAVRAITNCLGTETTDVQECRIESRLTGEPVALDLRVSAAPLCCQNENFTVFALRDITDEKRRQVLERIFFHDILNSAGSLHAIVQILDQLHGAEEFELKQTIRNLSGQVVEEIQSHRDLVAAETGQLAVTVSDVDVTEILDHTCTLYRGHSAGHDKLIVVSPVAGQPVIWTDGILLGRVLGNLIKNALEASRRGQTVTVAFENKKRPVFSVHNSDVMPPEVQLQMFQRRSAPGKEEGGVSVVTASSCSLRNIFEARCGSSRSRRREHPSLSNCRHPAKQISPRPLSMISSGGLREKVDSGPRFHRQPVCGHIRRVQVAVQRPAIRGAFGAIPEEDLVGIAAIRSSGPSQ